MAFTWNITHNSRHTPWGGATGDADMVYLGVDWSDAVFDMSFALLVAAEPIITLTNAAAGSQGISATYDAGYVHPRTGEVVGATIIRPQIDEGTMELLNWGDDTTAPLVLYHDLLVTPAGEPQRVWFSGTFTILPGVGDGPSVPTGSPAIITIAEIARDAVGAALVAGDGIDITVSDGSDTITIDATGPVKTQTQEIIGGFIASPADKNYTLALKMAHGGTITETTTKCVTGTCTATFKINSTALGGTANAVSSSEQSQAHSSENVFAAGDDIVLTVSSNASCADMSFSIKYTRVLE